MIVVNTIAEALFKLDKIAPAPLEFQRRGSDNLLESRDSTLVAVITSGSLELTKTVGDGITLEVEEGVANARATLQLTAAELATFPVGNSTTIRFLEGAADPFVLLLKGRIIFE
jgi:hypothetical protein